VFVKYSTDNGKVDDVDKKENVESEDKSTSSSSEELESKDLLLKEIELVFENGYFFTDMEKMFSKL
jgi:hypothetical protein